MRKSRNIYYPERCSSVQTQVSFGPQQQKWSRKRQECARVLTQLTRTRMILISFQRLVRFSGLKIKCTKQENFCRELLNWTKIWLMLGFTCIHLKSKITLKHLINLNKILQIKNLSMVSCGKVTLNKLKIGLKVLCRFQI